MSVTNEFPTKVGQRVQEIYTDSRGWVVDLGKRHGVMSAKVDWDDKPADNLGDDDAVFPVEALRVVECIKLDADWYIDPGKSPFVEMVTLADTTHARYHWKDGEVSTGIVAARVALLSRCTRSWE